MAIDRWPPIEVTRLRTNLDETCRLIQFPDYDLDRNLEVHQLLCRFLVVRSCGYLEKSTLEICRAYVRARSGGPVRTFAHSWLERSKNPNPDNLGSLVARFDANMSEEFKAFMGESDGRLRREIRFLVDRRNKIAHGMSEGINQTKAVQLKGVACEVADWFILRFNPER